MSKTRRRARGEGSLFKQAKDGMWVAAVFYRDDATGKSKSKRRSSKDYATAVKNLRDLQGEVSSGVTGAAWTVSEWLDYWLMEIKRDELKPASYRDYKSIIELYVKPVIGKVRLNKLSPEDVRRMAKAAPSQRAAQKAHQLLHQALKDAVANRKVDRNVAQDQRRPKHDPEVRTGFSSEVARHILLTASRVDERMASRWAAAFFTGARQGELLGLTRDRVDSDVIDLSWQLQQLQKAHGCGVPANDVFPCGRVRPGWCPDAVWDLPRGFQYTVLHRSLALTKPKSLAGTRVVPLASPLVEMLKIEAARPGPNPHNLVWRHEDGRPVSPRDDARSWKLILEAAGVPHKGLHCCRHTTATLLMECGVNTQVITEIVGHSDAVTTQGYVHVDLSLRRAAVGMLSERLA